MSARQERCRLDVATPPRSGGGDAWRAMDPTSGSRSLSPAARPPGPARDLGSTKRPERHSSPAGRLAGPPLLGEPESYDAHRSARCRRPTPTATSSPRSRPAGSSAAAGRVPVGRKWRRWASAGGDRGQRRRGRAAERQGPDAMVNRPTGHRGAALAAEAVDATRSSSTSARSTRRRSRDAPDARAPGRRPPPDAAHDGTRRLRRRRGVGRGPLHQRGRRPPHHDAAAHVPGRGRRPADARPERREPRGRGAHRALRGRVVRSAGRLARRGRR